MKNMFVTDSRYEIAVKSEIDREDFEVSTLAEPVQSVLEKMTKGFSGKIRVGLDAHLFTKTQIDTLEKTDGIELVVNLEEEPLVVQVTKESDSLVDENLILLDHDIKYCGLSRESKVACVVDQLKE